MPTSTSSTTTATNDTVRENIEASQSDKGADIFTAEKIQERAAVDLDEAKKKGGNSKKDKKQQRKEIREKKFSYDMDSPEMREVSKCGYCGNPLSMTEPLVLPDGKKTKESIFPYDLPDKKLPTVEGGKKGEYRYRSPGAAEGVARSYLCNTCEGEKRAGRKRDARTVVVIKSDGTVSNMNVAEL